jgi:WD40 repeat protein
VYQLHAASINSLSIGEGLALTASDDTTLRLWPLDFSSYLLEAQHEAPVTSACLGSPDGLLLVAGCEDGSLGQLDVVGRQHSSLLRSHCGAVLDVAVHPNRWVGSGGGGVSSQVEGHRASRTCSSYLFKTQHAWPL